MTEFLYFKRGYEGKNMKCNVDRWLNDVAWKFKAIDEYVFQI